MNNVNAANVYVMQALNKFFQDFTRKIQEVIQEGELDSVRGLEFYWMTMDWATVAEQFHFNKQPFQGWQRQFAPAAMAGVAGAAGPAPAPAFLRV
jgi:predicted dehydrogenase